MPENLRSPGLVDPVTKLSSQPATKEFFLDFFIPNYSSAKVSRTLTLLGKLPAPFFQVVCIIAYKGFIISCLN